MKLLWKNSINNQNFAGNCGKIIVFRDNPNSDTPEKDPFKIYGGRDIDIEKVPNSLALESQDVVRDKVDNVIDTTAIFKAVGKERSEKKRSGGNVMGTFLGTEFEQQYWNPVFWFNLKLNSKNSFLKNLEASSDHYREVLSSSDYIVPNMEGAQFDKTFKETIKLITRGGGGAMDNSSYHVFNKLSTSVLGSFDQAINDATQEKKLGQKALLNREPFQKLKDMSFWRTARHRGMLDSILYNLKKARKEVEANIGLVNRKFDESLENTEYSVLNYEKSLETKSENNSKSVEFWDFIEIVSINPAKFLNNPLSFGIFWRKAFGTGNKYRVLDTIQRVYADKVVEFQKSRNLSSDMNSTLQNFYERDEWTSQNLGNLDFMEIYTNLQSSGLENYDKAVNENDFVSTVRRGLRLCKINIEDIFPDSFVRLSDKEKVLYIVKYINGNPAILDHSEFPIESKRKILRYFFDIISDEEKNFVAGGLEDEGTTNFLRKFVLKNSIAIRDAANDTLGALSRIQGNIRLINPSKFQKDATKIKSFASLYDQFLHEADDHKDSGSFLQKNPPAKSQLEKLTGQEQESVRSLLQLKELRNQLGKDNNDTSKKTGIFSIIAEKEELDKDLSKINLPPGNTDEEMAAEVSELKEAVKVSREKLQEMVGSETSVTFRQDSFNALKELYLKDFERLTEWQNAMRKLASSNFQFDIEPSHFQTMVNDLGSDLDNLLLQVPESQLDHETNRENLLKQHFQREIQSSRETDFSSALHYTSEQQSKIITDPENPLNKGTKFSRMEITEVTQTEGQLDFPTSLSERFTLKDLVVVRQDNDGSLILQDSPDGKKAFKLEKVNIEVDGNNQTRFHLKVWDRIPMQQGVNKEFKIPPSNPRIYSVLNFFEGPSSHLHIDKNDKVTQKTVSEIRLAA